MNDISFKTSKGEILKSMMRRPGTAKLIKEAMGSPVGSTSRAKAKKIFSIMGKLHASHDGMGGPGMSYDAMGGMMSPPEMETMNPASTAKGMVIFHKIPKPKITYGKAAQSQTGAADGAGGPGIKDGEGGLFDDLGSMLSTFTTPFANSMNQPMTNSNSYSSLFTPPSKTYSSLGQMSTPSPLKPPTPAAPVATMSTPKGPAYMSNGQIVYINPPAVPTSTVGGMSVATKTPNMSVVPPATQSQWQIPDSSYTAPNIQGPSSSSNYGSSNTGSNIASTSVASYLGVSPQAPLSSVSIPDLAQAIAKNEGYTNGTSTIAIANNNPGNLKFVGQPGAVQGSQAADGGYFAKFATAQDGWNALQNDLQAKYSSGKYSTISDLMNVYSPDSGNPANGSTPSKYTGLSALASASVDNSTGAGMFAVNQLMDPNNPITHGKTMEQMEADNQTNLWAKYNIGGLQTEEARLREEGAQLPKDVTSYITARDQYLVQTDKQISDFMQNSMSNTDMSNPNNAAKANAQLNYLYTLRGRQNQSYIGYLNDAVDQHQAELDHVTNQYSTALNSYEIDLKNQNAITEGQYKLYASALSDMYTAVDGAPLKDLQLQAYKQQILDAHTTAISDAAKASAQGGYLEQYGKLKGHVIDNDGNAIPGLDLVKQIQDLSVLDPSIDPANIIQAYTEGVTRYMNTPDTQGTATTPGIGSAEKKKMAEAAIQQFAHLAIAGADNPNTVILGQTSANQIAQSLAASVGGSIGAKGIAPQLMEAVKTLAPTGFFAAKTPPTADQFAKTVTSKTRDPLDDSIARAIYAVFDRYVQDGGSPASAVNAFLYPTSSTSDRAAPAPYTADQFAQNIGTIYASNVVSQAFASQ